MLTIIFGGLGVEVQKGDVGHVSGNQGLEPEEPALT